jgi:hypothetical protein
MFGGEQTASKVVKTFISPLHAASINMSASNFNHDPGDRGSMSQSIRENGASDSKAETTAEYPK